MSSIKTGYVLHSMAMDILGSFPESQAGNSYIMVVPDYFIRQMKAYPVLNQKTKRFIAKKLDEFFFILVCHQNNYVYTQTKGTILSVNLMRKCASYWACDSTVSPSI